MKNKFPNASILTIITQAIKDSDVENILFMYVKVVPDFYPKDDVFWYEGSGKNGHPNNVWNDLSIRQWTACAKDSVAMALFESIISTKHVRIDNENLRVNIPSPFTSKTTESDPQKNRGDSNFETFHSEDNQLVPQEFFQLENLQLLSGYKIGSSKIKALFPPGLFEEKLIYNRLKEGIWAVKELRTPYLTFRGVRKTSQKGVGSKQMVGFYQRSFDPTANYTALFRNKAEQVIGQAQIDQQNGFFKVDLLEPSKNGRVEITVDDQREKEIDYVLIQDIDIRGHIANTTYKDTYDRTFLISADKRARPASASFFTWQRDVYADEIQGNKKLSDQIKALFDYLGPKILIADPYFLNNIRQEKVTNQFILSHCQTAFINALIHSAIEKGIVQFNVLGCSRVTNQLDKDDDDDIGDKTKIEVMFETYEKLFRKFIKENKLEKYLPSSTIVFKRAISDFHNRYWFSLSDHKGTDILDKCVIVTNSVGNINEVDFMPVTDPDQLLQIKRKYSLISKNADTKLII